jgi:CubicO group peptidase (beta-lactamase class C family)
MFHASKTAGRGDAISVGMKRLLCVLLVACGSSSPQPAPRLDGIAAAIERDLPKTTSVLVMRRGTVVYEQYFGGADAETLHDTRSVGKSFTSLAMGIAIERGVVSGLDAKVFEYLGDLKPFANDTPLKQAITVEDLLTMASALECNDDDEDSPGNEENMYPLQKWARWAADIPTQKTWTRDASGRGPWHYCTAGTVLLGQAIQRAAKQEVDLFIAEHIFRPLGITRWEFARSPTNEVMTGGGLRLRTRDWATAMEMLRAGGKHGGVQVVPAAYLGKAWTVQRKAMPEQDYGYLFWHRTYRTRCGDHGAWFMGGNGGNAIVAVPGLEAVIVVTRTNYNQRGMHQQTTALVEKEILPGLCGT